MALVTYLDTKKHTHTQKDMFSLFRIYIPVWLQNRLLSAGLDPVLSQTEKLCIATNYRQFSTNINKT